MKISLNWIKEYTQVGISLDEFLAKIGSQLGAVEEVTSLGRKYEGVLVVKVVTCEKHSDADKLSVCMIDDGGASKDISRNGDGLIQVVCGADNIASGQTVIWLPPGTIVPETYKTSKEFGLEVKDIRGIVSNGMIASSKELDLGDDHSGIVVLEEEIKPGTSLAEVFGLNDYIIDVENKMFTHRPDCFGLLGVAREIAGIQLQQFKSPDWYLYAESGTWGTPSGKELPLEVINKAPKLVPRFMAVAIGNIKVKPSPFKMQTYLARVGIKPINNIVDITNYMMYLTGQPLHAYDYDKLSSLSTNQVELIARTAEKGEKISLLGGKSVDIRPETIVIATGKQVVGIGGVMGGADTEVDENTQNIILECANFDMYSIRKAAFAHGLFTDAVTRFSKGQSPMQNDKVIAQTAKMIIAEGGQIASRIIDDNHSEQNKTVQVSVEFINNRLGLDLDTQTMSNLLENVEFGVEPYEARGQQLNVLPPFWRTDIAIPEDIAEEVGRLYGFDKIPLLLPGRNLSPSRKNKELEFNNQIRSILSSAGSNEVLSYSFVHGNLLEKTGQDKSKAFQLANALSPDLQYYRMSITPSLLEKIHPNIKQGFNKFALFEIGKCHIKQWSNSLLAEKVYDNKDIELPLEEKRLAFVLADSTAGNDYPAYYSAKTFLEYLAGKLGVELGYEKIPENIEIELNRQLAAPFDINRRASVVNKQTGNYLGIIGEFNPQAAKQLKLPVHCAGFELDIDLLKLFIGQKSYHPLSKYPRVEQDITLKVAGDIKYSLLEDCISSFLEQKTSSGVYSKIMPLDIYQPDNTGYKHITFRVTIVSYDKTLKSDEVNAMLDEAAEEAKKELQAVRV